MNILYICADHGIPVLGKKGASVHVREMSNAFIRAGHSVIIVAPMATKSLWEKSQDTQAEFIPIPVSKNAVNLIRTIKAYTNALDVASSLSSEIRRMVYNEELEVDLLRRFKNSPTDVIYVRASLYSTVGVTLKKILGIPLIVEINSPLPLEQSLYRSSETNTLAYAAERKLLTHADAILCVSQELKNYVESLGVHGDRVSVIPNGVNPQFFRPRKNCKKIREKLGLDSGPILGFVGGLRPWHGVGILPELLERMKAYHSDVKLLIVGEGPLKERLSNEFSEKNLGSNIIFAGNIPHIDIPDMIHLFDIALAPYAQPKHNFYFSPLKLFEYMACAVPVVTTRIGQISEVIQHNETGLLYDPEDIEALTSHCLNIIENPKLAQWLGVKASQRVKEKYTWDHNVKRVIEIIESL